MKQSWTNCNKARSCLNSNMHGHTRVLRIVCVVLLYWALSHTHTFLVRLDDSGHPVWRCALRKISELVAKEKKMGKYSQRCNDHPCWRRTIAVARCHCCYIWLAGVFSAVFLDSCACQETPFTSWGWQTRWSDAHREIYLRNNITFSSCVPYHLLHYTYTGYIDGRTGSRYCGRWP